MFSRKKLLFALIFLAYLLPVAGKAQESDATLQKFSSTFQQFSPDKCHFTNNQGINIYGTSHDGYDFSCVPHSYLPLKIAIPLEIIETGHDYLYGNFVLAKDPEGKYRFLFAHLSRIYVKKGQVTDPDKTLFLMGNSGNSSGIHLHLEILKDGFPVQLSPETFSQFSTIYRKQESSPEKVLCKAYKISLEEAQEKYLRFVDAQIYPLNWFKLFALSKYENRPMEEIIFDIKKFGWHRFSNFSYYLLQKGLKNYSKRNYELNRTRAYFNILERERFATLRIGDLLTQIAEQNFRKKNSDTYYPKKGVAGAKTKK
ncbi:MAG: M23 family metallopeptidase [Candidatus Paceibacterota bacterium]